MNHFNMTDTVFWQRRPPLVNLGLTLHHFVGAKNIQELNTIHKDAKPTALYYVSTIFFLYFMGLMVILVHYMNSSYGDWSWTLGDLWEEFYSPSPRPNTSNPEVTPSKSRSHKSDPELVDIEITTQNGSATSNGNSSGSRRSRISNSLRRLKEMGKKSSSGSTDGNRASSRSAQAADNDRHLSIDDNFRNNHSVSTVSEVGSATLISICTEESSRRRLSSLDNVLTNVDRNKHPQESASFHASSFIQKFPPFVHCEVSQVGPGSYCEANRPARNNHLLEGGAHYHPSIVHGHHHCYFHGLQENVPICEEAEEEEEYDEGRPLEPKMEQPLETKL
ncbi:hypothetical protein TCAL_08147 [Tigriopus californicus]|uniref:Uncharacterized protein n=1 Tax=Tigriopus californicus TaxID=6832 RepID=A0A553P427_TIGCA|nr:hypothetical protein TCAL_08147 [Tigriopus californicus]|eukprot:TCALIF_08147-PA protein Name:"Protein of unknown function" AED:0.12 eAED:0.12 QI:387/1/1/1/0.66/0.5/4/88/333